MSKKSIFLKIIVLRRKMSARKEPDKTTFTGRLAFRLRRLRERAKLTPAEVADKVGAASKQTIYDWESGKSQPRLSILPILAELYKVPVRRILPKE